jgi:coenzyme F420-reducing hydrogenase gamma subunit
MVDRTKKAGAGPKAGVKKLIVGWFTFTCSEDSSIMLLELMNDRFFDWKDKIEFRNFRILKRMNIAGPFDVAFIEGAISTRKDHERLKAIRTVSEKLVAVGACAITGMPSTQRNFFDAAKKAEIKPILDKFGHLDKVMAVHEIVPVDANVPGCPMDTNVFLEVLDRYLKEFGVVSSK